MISSVVRWVKYNFFYFRSRSVWHLPGHTSRNNGVGSGLINCFATCQNWVRHITIWIQIIQEIPVIYRSLNKLSDRAGFLEKKLTPTGIITL